MSATVDDPLFEALSEGVCVLDAERRVVRHNQRFLAITGLPADVMKPGARLGDALAWLTEHGEFASPAQREEVIARFRAAGTEPFAYRRERRDGTFFEMRGRPLAGGGFLLVAEDLTEQRRAETTLRASDARMRRAFAEASVAINICDADGRYLEANEAFCRMVGYSLAELRELSFETITHPDDISLDRSFHVESFAGDDNCHVFEKRYIRKDGATIWTKLSVSMMRDDEGWPTNTIAIIEDITAQKRALEAKRESEAVLSRALESINEGFALFDPSGKLAVMNRHYSGYFPDGEEYIRLGMTFEEITRAGLARGAYRLPAGASAEGFLRDRQAARARGEATVFQTSGGRWLRAHDYRTPDGSVVALRSDVTELMRRSQALADSEERFRSLANNLPGVVFTVELDPRSGQRRLTYLGDTLPAALRIDRDAARRGEIGLVHSMPPEDAQAYLAAMERSAREMRPFSIDVRFIGDGAASPQWTRIAATPRRLANGVVRWDGIGLDVTELTERTRALRESESLFRTLANNLPGVVFTFEHNRTTGERRVTYMSDAVFPVLGVERDRILSSEVRLIDFMVPEDKKRWLAAMAESTANLTPIATDVRFDVPGRTLRWCRLNVTPRPLGDGWIRWDGIALDITEQRAAEEQLRQGFKMEALGQLTGGIAHDFNNVLTVMVGSAELLQDAVEDAPDDTRQLVRNIMMAGAQGADLTRRLLAFARRQPLKPETLDVNCLMADIAPLLERALGGGIAVALEPSVSRCAAHVDRSQLENAVLNLVTNARDAMPEGGRVAITVALCGLDAAEAAHLGGIAAGDYVRISVADQGGGMPREVIARATEPFFTTKPEGKGTGLGLSMVYGFVCQSGGAMAIDSAPGRGTTVHLYLPRIVEETAGAGRRGRVSGAPGGDETILVVEDEAPVRDTLSRMLGNLGYRVTGAASGPEALATLSARDDIDLLFTGLSMPGGLDGRALAAAAVRRRPALRVLYTSGNSQQAPGSPNPLDPDTPLLEKPFTLDELARSVRRALGTVAS
ncbi:MAG: PAS-domain containing protein [Alphaproteobacteria bacterium]|nr:PAS-domain containing protein [Alphaproteobacteria bacterium]MCW5743213.1 PAS-domain containing protein [Alphaproteobacteria bacterium]